MGLASAVVRPGAAPAFDCLGVADIATNRAVTPDTTFRIASISKTMTAIAVMQLRDEGHLDLDEPVNGYLKTFTVEPPAGADAVTIRHLLTHTSGIGELASVGDIVRRDAWGLGKPHAEPAVLASIYRGAVHTDVPAGTKWAYANHAFAILGQVVEDITGESFVPYMHERVFAPLGMESTGYVRNERMDAELATGSHWMLGRLRTVKDYDLTVLGPGSVVSSLADMARYAEWLASAGATAPALLKTDTLHEMMSPQFAVHPGFPGMGLAFWLDHAGDHRTAGHDGNVPGFTSALLIAPDDEVGVVMLTNTASFFGVGVLAADAMHALLDARSPAAAREAAAIPEHPELWSDFVGYYAPAPGFLTNARVWQMMGGEIQVLVRNRELVVRALSPIAQLRRGLTLHAADATDPTLFVAEAEGLSIPIAFVRDASGGAARHVAIGPPSNTVLHRRSTLRSSHVRRSIAGWAAAALITRRLMKRRQGRQT
jgi:CubicO group peptidase (beta-lactamase class C family)